MEEKYHEVNDQKRGSETIPCIRRKPTLIPGVGVERNSSVEHSSNYYSFIPFLSFSLKRKVVEIEVYSITFKTTYNFF